MNTGSSKSLDGRAWRDLYKAALFEVDNARLPGAHCASRESTYAKGTGVVTQPETTSKRNKLWMTRCAPCMLCGTHRKRATVHRIAVRLPRSTHRCCAIPFLGSPCVHLSPTAYRACRREII